MRVAEEATTQEAWASAAMVRSNVGKCQRNEITDTLWSLGEKLFSRPVSFAAVPPERVAWTMTRPQIRRALPRDRHVHRSWSHRRPRATEIQPSRVLASTPAGRPPKTTGVPSRTRLSKISREAPRAHRNPAHPHSPAISLGTERYAIGTDPRTVTEPMVSPTKLESRAMSHAPHAPRAPVFFSGARPRPVPAHH
jgi:hypothetical protein